MVDIWDLTSCVPEDWKLLGAGRANAVYAYAGGREDLVNKVLRLAKRSALQRPADAMQLETAVWAVRPDLQRADGAGRAAIFVDQIVAPMLGRQYIAQQAFVHVAPDVTSALLAAAGQQPEHSTPCIASLLPNLTRFSLPASAPTLCIELKPKWGCMPRAATIHPDNAAKWRMSKFQLQQHLKLAQGKITRLSGYDPLDLFSGEAGRIGVALQRLLEVPQNNFRMFSDGQRLPFSGLAEPGGSNQLAEALHGWSTVPAEQRSPVLVAALQTVLLQEGVLANLLCMQQLDQHDIEGIHPLYQALLQHRGHEPSLQADIHGTAQQQSAIQPAGLVAALTQGADSSGSPSPTRVSPLLPALEHTGCGQRRHKCNAAKRLGELAKCQAARGALLALPPAKMHAALRDYMTAVTAKDCSVMVTMRRAAQGGESGGSGGSKDAGGGDVQGVVTIGAESFEYKVAAVDLDFKPLEKIEEHFELDCAIMDAYRQHCMSTR